MAGTDIKLNSSDGGEFDCYLVTPDDGPAPGIVLVADVFGVGPDLRAICDELGEAGFVVSAPDFFWRTDDPGPLTREQRDRARARSQPRQERIETGVTDVKDAVADLKDRAECNGKVAVAGFCYGGPYCMIGPARLGLDAGFSYHGTNLEDWQGELANAAAPISIHWGTADHAAPQEVLDMFQAEADARDNVNLSIYPGVEHGYTSRSAPAWDAEAYKDSFDKTVAILNTLR